MEPSELEVVQPQLDLHRSDDLDERIRLERRDHKQREWRWKELTCSWQSDQQELEQCRWRHSTGLVFSILTRVIDDKLTGGLSRGLRDSFLQGGIGSDLGRSRRFGVFKVPLLYIVSPILEHLKPRTGLLLNDLNSSGNVDQLSFLLQLLEGPVVVAIPTAREVSGRAG